MDLTSEEGRVDKVTFPVGKRIGSDLKVDSKFRVKETEVSIKRGNA